MMESYDPVKAAQVWQRVRGGQPAEPVRETLLPLIAEEMADATIYLALSRQLTGRESEVLRRLFEEEQSHAACLKGIYTLTTGNRPVIRNTPPAREPPELTLRKCYGREMRCLAAYEERMSDREYGPVFTRLAEQEREHCRLVLEILGNLMQTAQKKN